MNELDLLRRADDASLDYGSVRSSYVVPKQPDSKSRDTPTADARISFHDVTYSVSVARCCRSNVEKRILHRVRCVSCGVVKCIVVTRNRRQTVEEFSY